MCQPQFDRAADGKLRGIGDDAAIRSGNDAEATAEDGVRVEVFQAGGEVLKPAVAVLLAGGEGTLQALLPLVEAGLPTGGKGLVRPGALEPVLEGGQPFVLPLLLALGGIAQAAGEGGKAGAVVGEAFGGVFQATGGVVQPLFGLLDPEPGAAAEGGAEGEQALPEFFPRRGGQFGGGGGGGGATVGNEVDQGDVGNAGQLHPAFEAASALFQGRTVGLGEQDGRPAVAVPEQVLRGERAAEFLIQEANR